MSLLFGFNPPFVGGQQKYFSRQEDERLVKNDLLQLLLTIPGERVMRPSFGVNLRNVVFEQLDDVTIELLREDISTAVANFLPTINLLGLNIRPDANNNAMVVSVAFNMVNDPVAVIQFSTLIEVRGNG
jgi:phage baseplate assembly protein W